MRLKLSRRRVLSAAFLSLAAAFTLLFDGVTLAVSYNTYLGQFNTVAA